MGRELDAILLAPDTSNDTLRPALSMNLSNPNQHTSTYTKDGRKFRAFSICKPVCCILHVYMSTMPLLCHFPLWPLPNCKIAFCLEGIFREYKCLVHIIKAFLHRLHIAAVFTWIWWTEWINLTSERWWWKI